MSSEDNRSISIFIHQNVVLFVYYASLKSWFVSIILPKVVTVKQFMILF